MSDVQAVGVEMPIVRQSLPYIAYIFVKYKVCRLPLLKLKSNYRIAGYFGRH